MKMTLKTSLFHEAESLVDAITDITLTKKCAKPEPILTFIVSERENPLFGFKFLSLLIVVPLVHTRLVNFLHAPANRCSMGRKGAATLRKVVLISLKTDSSFLWFSLPSTS